MSKVTRTIRSDCGGFVTDEQGQKIPVSVFAGRVIRRTKKLGGAIRVTLLGPDNKAGSRIVFETHGEYERSRNKVVAN